MTTKERIMEEALTLFSIKGYKGTSVKNIADAVGIKDSSLYKHFRSKQEIFDTIVSEMCSRMGSLSEVIGLPDDSNLSKAAENYGKFNKKQLQEISEKVFLFYLEDPYVSRFWRIANMEQYQNTEIYEVFRHIFMEESIAYQSALFNEMVKQEIFISVSPDVIAMNFYTPIFFLLSKYAGHPEKKDEAIRVLDAQIEEFYRIYKR